MRATWLICVKDLRARLRDRSALLIGIVVPLGLAFIFNSIFNSIFSGISGASNVISLGVVNADHGLASQQFTSHVLPAVGRSGLITIHTEPSLARPGRSRRTGRWPRSSSFRPASLPGSRPTSPPRCRSSATSTRPSRPRSRGRSPRATPLT